MYRSTTPALPPVADPAARAALPSAPAVAPNTPLDNELLSQAITEHRMREAAILEHVAHDYPAVDPWTGAVAPPWFTATMDSIDTRFASTNAHLDVLDNTARKAYNVLIEDRAKTQSWLIQKPLMPFIRVNAGIGPGHPGEPRVAEKDLPVVALGQEFLSPAFPHTVEELRNMRAENIQVLSMVMNNDFEIEDGDDLDMQRAKLRVFLFYGV